MEISSCSMANFNRPSGSSTIAFRDKFSGELKGNIVYDNQAVLDKLLADSAVPHAASGNYAIVNHIVRSVQADCVEELEELRGVAGGRKVGEDKVRPESLMYLPLSSLFDTIDRIRAEIDVERPQFRQLICSSSVPLVAHDPIYPKAFKLKPDFVVADLPRLDDISVLLDRRAVTQVMWRQCPSFFELKATNQASNVPVPSRPEVVKDTLTQAADYARAILSCRPFQLFVFGVILCGGDFWVGLFDRRGVVLAPKFSIFDDDGLRTFIRVVLRLTWEMTSHDLGLDPTVALLDGHTFYAPQHSYPRFAVKMGGVSDTRRWVTYDPPLWVSHSFMGRGTSVWTALDGNNTPTIIKVAWRTHNRTGEVDIYDNILRLLRNKVPRGMVMCYPVSGGDVYLPSQLGRLLSVNTLRNMDGLPTSSIDVNLHRVTFPDYGKPLWKYNDPEQLVRAMCMALEAHKTLCDHGILHRDISAGNILIRMRVEYKHGRVVSKEQDLKDTEGFLTDFEFAALPHADTKEVVSYQSMDRDPTTGQIPIDVPTPNATPEQRQRRIMERSKNLRVVYNSVSNPKTAGDGMTGTAMFMASSLLYAIRTGTPISRTAAHDVESFAWVFIYVVYKHVVDELEGAVGVDPVIRQSIIEEFDTAFSGYSAETLLQKRSGAFLEHNNLLTYLDSSANTVRLGIAVYLVWELLDRFAPRLQKPPPSYRRHPLATYRASLPENQRGLALMTTDDPPVGMTHEGLMKIFQIFLDGSSTI